MKTRLVGHGWFIKKILPPKEKRKKGRLRGKYCKNLIQNDYSK